MKCCFTKWMVSTRRLFLQQEEEEKEKERGQEKNYQDNILELESMIFILNLCIK